MIVTVDDQHLKNIADAIRTKSETEDSITVDKMAEKIEGIKNNIEQRNWTKIIDVNLEEEVQQSVTTIENADDYTECLFLIRQCGGDTTTKGFFIFAWANTISIDNSSGFAFGATATSTTNQAKQAYLHRIQDKVIFDSGGQSSGNASATINGGGVFNGTRPISKKGLKFGIAVNTNQTLPIGFSYEIWAR